MSLRVKQSKFAKMLPLLLDYIHLSGYEATFGDTWAFNLWPLINFLGTVFAYVPGPLEPPIKTFIKLLKRHAHSKRSCHYVRLAVDLNLFKDGKYLTSTKAHKQFGEFWESIGGTWGGRFRDGNHYSLEHKGRK